MPHYADGSEAKAGDHVTGKLFNSEGIKAGVIVSISPGCEACNAMVQFTEVLPLDAPAPRMALRPGPILVHTQSHGGSGPKMAVYTCHDYCDTNKLTKVG